MQGCNVCRWRYFRSQFLLGLKSSGALVTMDTVTWHILKWPPDLRLGVLNSALLLIKRTLVEFLLYLLVLMS